MPTTRMLTGLYCLLFLGVPLFGQVQQPIQTDTSWEKPKPFLAVYPVLFYLPETRLGFGGAGVYSFYPGKKRNTRPSQIQALATYTLNDQLQLFLSYQYFLNEDQTEVFGEFGYYDYIYFYYGIGNNTDFEDEETYAVSFPRIRINGLQEVFSNFRMGLTYKFDGYDITGLQGGGALETEQPTGYDGGIISSIGIITRYDTRDNINSARKGVLATLTFEGNTNWLGSKFDYDRLLLDLSWYHPLKNTNSLAFHLYTGSIGGQPPFQEFLFMGGSRRARGIIEGRFRESNILLFQAEYRFPLIWKFRGVAFASTGRVGEHYDQLFAGRYHTNYGLGLRFVLDETERIYVRGDIGFGSDSPGIYFTIGEAF